MGSVIFLTGRTGGSVFENVARLLMASFERYGFESIVVDFSVSGAMEALSEALENRDVYFVLGFIGVAKDLSVDTDDGPRNFWDMAGVPYIGLHGDSPAYYFDRHVNPGIGFASLYCFREHYLYRKKFPGVKGMIGVVPSYLFDPEPLELMDFKAKEQGKLYFLKNGNDPNLLRELWRIKFPHSIYTAMMDMSDALVARMATENAPDIDRMVLDWFLMRGRDITEMWKMRLFFCGQLDDYLRRAKSTMIASVLSEFPVEIQGVNWEHLNFANTKCTFTHGVDYQTSRELIKSSLGVIDMSPNTDYGWHDRPVRTWGLHTLCLTNKQKGVTELFGEDAEFAYTFDKDVLREKVADVLAHPKRYVEIGAATSKRFAEVCTEASVVNYFIEVADTLRLNLVRNYIAGLPEYFVWPPESSCVAK